MKTVKWIAGIGIVATLTFGMTSDLLPTSLVSSATADAFSSERTSASYQAIDILRERVNDTYFDPTLRDHLVRKQRIAFYIDKAVDYHQHEWNYSRDDAIERAYNILEHHERMESSTYASL